MKKIALITFHASHNNGSMLQALALQRALMARNCMVKIIDFSNDGQRNLYAPLPIAHNWKQQIKKNYMDDESKGTKKTIQCLF